MHMTIPLSLLVVHYIADFLLQTDWQAQNKSKNWQALIHHVCTYAPCFLWWGVPFVAVTLVTHFITDAITSRITSRLWAKKQVHWFFAVIGFDQLIHFTTLALTYRWLS
jgi:hypothetical protein